MTFRIVYLFVGFFFATSLCNYRINNKFCFQFNKSKLITDNYKLTTIQVFNVYFIIFP